MEKELKGALKGAKAVNDLNFFSEFKTNLGKALKVGEYEAATELYSKGIHATKEDEKKALDHYEKINPLYEYNQKLDEEEKQKRINEDFKKKRLEEWKNNIYNMFKKSDNVHENITYKNNLQITQNEIDNARKHSWFESKDKSLSKRLDDKVSSWYKEHYGTKSKVDATGRNIYPETKTANKTEATALKTRDNYTIDNAYSKISKAVAEKEGGPQKLQTALNSYTYEPKLKVDGYIGPKTTSRLKQTVVEDGTDNFIKKYATFV